MPSTRLLRRIESRVCFLGILVQKQLDQLGVTADDAVRPPKTKGAAQVLGALEKQVDTTAR